MEVAIIRSPEVPGRLVGFAQSASNIIALDQPYQTSLIKRHASPKVGGELIKDRFPSTCLAVGIEKGDGIICTLKSPFEDILVPTKRTDESLWKLNTIELQGVREKGLVAGSDRTP